MNPGQSLFVFVFYYNLCDIDLFALNRKDVCGILLYAHTQKKRQAREHNIYWVVGSKILGQTTLAQILTTP